MHTLLTYLLTSQLEWLFHHCPKELGGVSTDRCRMNDVSLVTSFCSSLKRALTSRSVWADNTILSAWKKTVSQSQSLSDA